MRIGVYPGSFNPPTVAHEAIATAALEQCALDVVRFVLSRDALGKDPADLVRIEDRATVLRAMAERWAADHEPDGERRRGSFEVTVTDHRLIADIAAGADVIVVGADKWAQVIDPAWYDGSVERRDALVHGLPHVAYAPRSSRAEPAARLDDVAAGATVLMIDDEHLDTSATHARAGRPEWMVPEARAFAARTGAWSSPDRYAAWLASPT